MNNLYKLEKRILLLEKAVKFKNSDQYILWKTLVDNGPKYISELKNLLSNKIQKIEDIIDSCINIGCITKPGRKYTANVDFDWNSVNTSNIVNNSNKTISAKEDTDIKKYLNKEYLNECFDKFNKIFFNNKITKIQVVIANSRELSGGFCESLTRDNIIKPHKICIFNKVFKNRYVIENVLVHEMCHAYQAEILCNCKLDAYTEDCEVGSGTHGHGPKFFKAANLVNSSPENKEGYEVSQYCGEDDFKNKTFKDISGAVGFKLSGLNLLINNYSKKMLSSNKLDDQSLFKYKDGDTKSFVVDTFYDINEEAITDKNTQVHKLCNLISNGSLIPTDSQDKNVLCISDVNKTLQIMNFNNVKRFLKSNRYYIFDGELTPLRNIKFDDNMYELRFIDNIKIRKLVEAGMLKQITSKKDEEYSYINESLDDLEHDENIEILSEVDNIDIDEKNGFDVVRTF